MPRIKNIGMNEEWIIKQKVKAFREYILDFLLRKKIEKETIINDNNYKNYIPNYGREKVRFREIVVRSKPEAEKILKNILNGADFETLAKKKSINKNSKKAGDTGFVIMGQGTYREEVENVIFKLKNGEISEILKTREGYSIFKTIKSKDLTDQEREKFIQNLQWKLILGKVESLIEKFRSKANIKIFSGNVKKIQELKNLDDNSLQIELAEVNKTIIKLADVVNKMKTPINSIRSHHFRSISNIEEMISHEINEKLLVNEAIRIGLDKDPAFQNATRRFEELYRADIYITNILLNDDVTFSEEELKKFYNEYKDSPRYQNLPEFVRGRHILLDDEGLAKEISKQLKNGANFAEMARKHSIFQPTSKNGGDLGYLERGQMMTKEEEEAIFKLSEGQISEIIKKKQIRVYGSSTQSFYNIFSYHVTI